MLLAGFLWGGAGGRSLSRPNPRPDSLLAPKDRLGSIPGLRGWLADDGVLSFGGDGLCPAVFVRDVMLEGFGATKDEHGARIGISARQRDPRPDLLRLLGRPGSVDSLELYPKIIPK